MGGIYQSGRNKGGAEENERWEGSGNGRDTRRGMEVWGENLEKWVWHIYCNSKTVYGKGWPES